MRFPKNARSILSIGIILLFFVSTSEAQTKKLKRPKSTVGISSVDRFVRESFDIYDKVYKYDGYAEAGTPLDDEDIDVLEDALDDLEGLSESAPDVLGDLDGTSALKQAKATLQINKAKKALKYSIKTTKELLLNQREREKKEEDSGADDTASTETSENDTGNSGGTNGTSEPEETNISDGIEINSKFDFVPGDKLLFFDDFSQDFIGDFPSKWNTNASGEVVKVNSVEGKWFELKGGYGLVFIPAIDPLPEEYTIEFDLLLKGVDKQTSSTAYVQAYISDNNGFRDNGDYVFAGLPLGQFGAFNIRVTNRDKTNPINSALTADIRKDVLNKPHISIAVNKKRYRLWVNQKKYVDIPQFIYKPETLKYLKFNVKGIRDGKDRVFISNLKIAEGGVDLRRKLLQEGKISTNGILFDSGSANIKAQSYGIIRQISQVLMQDETIKLNIIGHTDADGSEETNLKLSKARANAVKQALITIYKIPGNRLQTDGKGESMPVSDNTSSDGKAQNRRVEFVKI